ncbi:hypothetical protein SEUCBS140593_000278 [Sporothrix eucalyptigena]|uniref:Uncharacterized protein n=1 Tax=Sporothrix eucalyptigena TaxID=1812306 RepID=A0ABP0ANC8_9PEZI
MEYIDGIGADEAAYEWGSEETRAFMGSIQSIRQTLATTKSSCIQAIAMLEDIGGNKNSDGDCEMSDGGYNADREEGRLATSDSIHDTFVQDELFDHIWQEMERGPFESEADFVKSVSVALQRRGTSAPRLDLVHRMVNQLRKACSTNESFPLQHANLTLGNFLVRRSSQPGGGGTPEIVGVLGWGQAGFYPAWWDLAKLAASEDRLLVEIAMRDETFPRYSQHASVMLHVRDIIY